MITSAKVSKTCSSSYVLISIILLSRLRTDGMRALPAARVSMLYVPQRDGRGGIMILSQLVLRLRLRHP